MATASKVLEALRAALESHQNAHRDHLEVVGLLEHLETTRGGVGLQGGPAVTGGNDG
jgi:hypothetical protein